MKKHPMWLGVALIAGTMSSAHADIKYTQVTRMGEGGDGQMSTSLTKYVRQNAERTEMNMNMGPVQMKNISLRFCDKNQTVKIDPKLKIYTTAADGNSSGASGTAATGKPSSQPQGTGKFVVTTNVQDLGTEKVAGFNTRHYMLTMRMQGSGCAGDSDTSMKTEVWVSDIQDASPCDKGGPDYSAMAGITRPTCKITYEQKGDVDAVAKVYRGLVLRMKMYDVKTNKVTMTQEVTMLSQAKLDDEPFAIPADYKQVSEQEFQQAQSRAMMEAMMSQTKSGGNNGNAKNNKDEDNDDNAKDNEETEKNNEEEEKPRKEEKPKKRPKLPFGLPF